MALVARPGDGRVAEVAKMGEGRCLLDFGPRLARGTSKVHLSLEARQREQAVSDGV